MIWRNGSSNSYIDSFFTNMSIALNKLWWTYDLISGKITWSYWQFWGNKLSQLFLIWALAINLIKVYTSKYFRGLIERWVIVWDFFFHTFTILCLTSSDLHSIDCLRIPWYCGAISPAVNFSIKYCIGNRFGNDAGIGQFDKFVRLPLILLVEVLLQKF